MRYLCLIFVFILSLNSSSLINANEQRLECLASVVVYEIEGYLFLICDESHNYASYFLHYSDPLLYPLNLRSIVLQKECIPFEMANWAFPRFQISKENYGQISVH